MNFFRSILADDEESPKSGNSHESGGDSSSSPSAAAAAAEGNSNGVGDGWSFGDLIKTLSVQSESVIETYRKDLKEFGLGLRKESEIFRETASRAVKELPASLEATASVAHGALDGVLKSTADIIAKESTIFSPEKESDTPESNRSFPAGRYSWFEAQLSAIQNDLSTFCEEPENAEEYGKWKLGFQLDDHREEIDTLIGENGVLESLHEQIVPNEVDHGTFWCRYFYRVDKLKQQEKVRANLMQRAISVEDDDDELTWEVDDDEENDNAGDSISNRSSASKEVKGGSDDGKVDDKVNDSSDSSSTDKETKLEEATEVKMAEEVVKPVEETVEEKGSNDEKVVSGDNIPAVSSGGVAEEEEEDMGWDEIGNTGSDEDQKAPAGAGDGSRNKDELRKRLDAMEDDDEDLNWDIEDEEVQTKA
ncbi:uncharacterized protein LOC127242920 [Andrographis paniculata]|uniref:uncharacterized protein LOC127242920 n=1 Tax=Andrographis paniculata TaxID=175694 RepID=UPI0021E94683|nr:uncharacterized protein LOC127242920 [Andrographis paniculata]